MTFKDLAPHLFVQTTAPALTVVLIDELDKAPRDLPNDLLRELEDMTFEIRELGVRIRVPRKESSKVPAMRPIVVITSNAERSLPEPFLRRVAFYDIPDPTDDKLKTIVGLRYLELKESPAVAAAVRLFRAIEEALPAGERVPGTAEFLAWFHYLEMQGLGKTENDPRRLPAALRASVSILAKTSEAVGIANSVLDKEIGTTASGSTDR